MSLLRKTDIKKHMAPRTRKHTHAPTDLIDEKRVAPFPFRQPESTEIAPNAIAVATPSQDGK